MRLEREIVTMSDGTKVEKLIYSPAEVKALLTAQHERDVRRAKEFLKANLDYYDRRDLFIEDFTKAMED